jgi:RNA polymerase sigma-70 factor, ECF subfamily
MTRLLDEWTTLLTAARAGNPEALGRVLQACRGYLLLIANREWNDDQLRAKEAPSDIVQDTFLEAQRDFGQFDGQTEDDLLAWLRTLLLHNLANCRRRWCADKRDAAREAPGPADDSHSAPPAPGPSPSAAAVLKEQDQLLRRALERLPEDQRLVILLRYQEERSFEEIGRRMNRSANAAQKLWARAVDRLQQELDASP